MRIFIKGGLASFDAYGQNIQTKRGKLKESAFVKGCSNMKQEAVEDHEKAWPVIFSFV